MLEAGGMGLPRSVAPSAAGIASSAFSHLETIEEEVYVEENCRRDTKNDEGGKGGNKGRSATEKSDCAHAAVAPQPKRAFEEQSSRQLDAHPS